MTWFDLIPAHIVQMTRKGHLRRDFFSTIFGIIFNYYPPTYRSGTAIIHQWLITEHIFCNGSVAIFTIHRKARMRNAHNHRLEDATVQKFGGNQKTARQTQRSQLRYHQQRGDNFQIHCAVNQIKSQTKSVAKNNRRIERGNVGGCLFFARAITIKQRKALGMCRENICFLIKGLKANIEFQRTLCSHMQQYSHVHTG